MPHGRCLAPRNYQCTALTGSHWCETQLRVGCRWTARMPCSQVWYEGWGWPVTATCHSCVLSSKEKPLMAVSTFTALKVLFPLVKIFSEEELK